MRIKNVNEYTTTAHEKVMEDEVELSLERGEECWPMKEYGNDDNGVKLYHLDEGCYWDFICGGRRARKALKECWAVDYVLNGIGTTAMFDDEVEAIDYAMKLIVLIKA